MHRGKLRVWIAAPNILSFCWIMICAKIFFTDTPEARNIFDYSIYGVCLSHFLLNFKSSAIKIDACRKLIIYFLFLLVICLFGIVSNMTVSAVTSVLGVLCVMAFVVSNSFLCDTIQAEYIKPAYYFVVFRLLTRTLRGDRLGNTIPAMLSFLTFGFLICVLSSWNNINGKKGFFLRLLDVFVLLISLFIMFYTCLVADSRSPLMTAIGIVLLIPFIVRGNKSSRKLKKIFWTSCVSLTLLVFLYINIHAFAWYDALNYYSVTLFGKNLDSSRSALWINSLESLSWLSIVLGKGTGALPTFRSYNSYHNSYIQLLMQNGVIGLCFLILILKTLWYYIADYNENKVCRVVLACFIGIIIYNAFECTLLQNKAFLGLCEWLVICMGIVQSGEKDILAS